MVRTMDTHPMTLNPTPPPFPSRSKYVCEFWFQSIQWFTGYKVQYIFMAVAA